MVLYAALGVALLTLLGPALADSSTPVAAAMTAAGAPWAEPVVRVGAATAALGAMLALLAGVGRTTLAMARERDLPGVLASVHPVHRVPDRAQLAIGTAVVMLVLVADLREVIGFSSVGVLLYYAVANLCALRQPPEQRRWPRTLAVVGLVGCLLLVVTLPPVAVLAGTGVILVGVLGRAVMRSRA